MTLLSSEAGSMDGAEDDDIEKEILVHLENIDVDAEDEDISDDNDAPTVDDGAQVDDFVDSIWSDINTRTRAFFGQCETHLQSVDEIKSQPYEEHLKKALDERGLKQEEFDEALRAVDDEEEKEVQPEQMTSATPGPDDPPETLRTTATPHQLENATSVTQSDTPRLSSDVEMLPEDDGMAVINPKCRIIEAWLETDEHIEKILEQRWNEYSDHMNSADSAMLLLREQNRSVMEKEIEEEKVKQQKMESDLRVKEELMTNEHEEDMKKNKTRLADISRRIKEERERLTLLQSQKAEAEELRRREAAIMIQRFCRGTLVRRIFGEEVKERMALARRKLENEKIIAFEKEMKRKKALELEKKRKLEENKKKEVQKKKGESEEVKNEPSSRVITDAADKRDNPEVVDQPEKKLRSATNEPDKKAKTDDSMTENAGKKKRSADAVSNDSVVKSDDVIVGKSGKSDDIIDSKSEKKCDDVIVEKSGVSGDVIDCKSKGMGDIIKADEKQSKQTKTNHIGADALQNTGSRNVDAEKSEKKGKLVDNEAEKAEAKTADKNTSKSRKNAPDVPVKVLSKANNKSEDRINARTESMGAEGHTEKPTPDAARNSASQETQQSDIGKDQPKDSAEKLDKANDDSTKILPNGTRVPEDKAPLGEVVTIGNNKKEAGGEETITTHNLYKKVSYTDNKTGHDHKSPVTSSVDSVVLVKAPQDQQITSSITNMERRKKLKTPRSKHDDEASGREMQRTKNHVGRSIEGKPNDIGNDIDISGANHPGHDKEIGGVNHPGHDKDISGANHSGNDKDIGRANHSGNDKEIGGFNNPGHDKDISCSSPRVSSASKEKSRKVARESPRAVNDSKTAKDAVQLVGSPRLMKSSGCVSCRMNQSFPSADEWRKNNQGKFSSRLKHLSSNFVEDQSRSKPPRLPRSVRNCESLTMEQIQQASRKNEEELSSLKFLSVKEVPQPIRVNSLSDFCPHLTVLVIPGCRVVSLEGLEICTALEYVDAKDNQIEFVQFSNHRHLVSLDLSRNKLRSIHGLSSASLMDLNLSRNRISRISGLHDCAHLQSLNLAHNEVTVCDGLSPCAFLQILDLSHNHISSVSLDDLPLIRRLNASDNDLVEVPNLTNNPLLQELVLSCNSISELHNMSTMWLPSLRILDLRSNSIAEIGVLHLPIVQNILLSTNLVNDLQQVITSLAPLQCLEELDILENPCSTLTDCRAQVVASLKELAILNGQAVSGRRQQDFVFDDDFVDSCWKMTTEFGAKSARFEKRLAELHGKNAEDFTPILNCIRRYYNQGERMAIKHREFHEGIDGEDDSSSQKNAIIDAGLDDSISNLQKKTITEGGGLHGADDGISSPQKNIKNDNVGLDGVDDSISSPQKNIENDVATLEVLEVVTKVNENRTSLNKENIDSKGDDLHKAYERMEVEKPEEFCRVLCGVVLLQALWRGWRTRRMIHQALAYADTNVIGSDEEFAQDFADVNDFNFTDWDEEQLEKLFHRPPPTPNLPPVSARRSLPSVRDEDVKGRDPRAGLGMTRNAWGLGPVTPPAPMVPPITHRPESSHSNTRTETIIDHGEDSFREESIPLSSSRHAKKKDKIMQDWGFKDEKCAAAMFERAKKIKYDPERRARMSKMSAQQRFMLFKKLESVSKPPIVSAKRHEAPNRQEYFKAMASQQSRADAEERREEASRSARTFEWVFNQPVNVDTSLNGGSDSRRPDDNRTSRTTNLPKIDRSSRLTGKVEREASSGSSRFSSAGRQGSCELPPIFPRRIFPEE